MNSSITIASIVLAMSLSTSHAVVAKNNGKLPKNAVPMETADVVALYADNSIDWKTALAFWKSDGSAFGYYPKKGGEAFSEGTWAVKGNEMCYTLEWRGEDKTNAPFIESKCQKHYRAGKKIWIENTKDDKKYQGDIWTGQEKKLRKGDIVSKKIAALKARFGY